MLAGHLKYDACQCIAGYRHVNGEFRDDRDTREELALYSIGENITFRDTQTHDHRLQSHVESRCATWHGKP